MLPGFPKYMCKEDIDVLLTTEEFSRDGYLYKYSNRELHKFLSDRYLLNVSLEDIAINSSMPITRGDVICIIRRGVSRIEAIKEKNELLVDCVCTGEKYQPQEILQMPWVALEWSVRASNALENLFSDVEETGLDATIGDLVALSERELLGKKNIGRKTIEEIKHKLREYGLWLRDSSPSEQMSSSDVKSEINRLVETNLENATDKELRGVLAALYRIEVSANVMQQ